MTNTKETTPNMTNTIKTKRTCHIEGCDEPMIGLGRVDNPNERRPYGESHAAIYLCPARYEEELALKDLDPFTREIRRQRVEHEARNR
jgi:hypothetical protein